MTDVIADVTFQAVAPDPGPIHTTLTYTDTDPHVIRAVFHTCSGDSEWHIGRDLLRHGLTESAGFADVRVWPSPNTRGDIVTIALTSPDGNVQLEVPRHILSDFLRRTYQVVPRGRESEHLDMDQLVGQLLKGQTR